MWEYVKIHKGKVVGVGVALFFSLVYLFFGFFRMIVVFLILALGYYIGSKLDRNESIEEILKKFIPEDFFNRNHR
ncbi:MAG: DUF2273 domain-containing protein [Thermicanus sp.]|nr:DUF2273 domain-containing protein [Thermicanus sp.]